MDRLKIIAKLLKYQGLTREKLEVEDPPLVFAFMQDDMPILVPPGEKELYVMFIPSGREWYQLLTEFEENATQLTYWPKLLDLMDQDIINDGAKSMDLSENK